MNDVIMASVAALKTQTDKAQFSLYTGFRSVRGRLKATHDMRSAERPVSLRIDEGACSFFETQSSEPQKLMRKVLEDHARAHRETTDR